MFGFRGLFICLLVLLANNCSGGNDNAPPPPSTQSPSQPSVSFSNATLQAYVKPSNTASGDTFGIGDEGRSEIHVALSGDTLALGLPGESSCSAGINGDQRDDRCFAAGAVYVFTRAGDAWSQQAYVKASNPGVIFEGPDGHPGDGFGASVAVDGDTLVVGAPLERSCATGVNGNQADEMCFGAGAAYVFTRTSGVWSQQAYLKASNTGPPPLRFDNAQFGRSVAVSGNTVAVGAVNEDSCATGIDGNQADTNCPLAGAVYVFTRTAGVWSQQAYIKASNTGAADAFGWNVALTADSLAVGALSEDSCATGIDGDQSNNACPGAGAVYVFTRTAGAWTHQAYIKASNTEAGDEFGVSVALATETLVVGADKESSCATGANGDQSSNGCSQTGAVYVYTRTGNLWNQQAYLKASNPKAGDGVSGDHFGISVALSEDTLAVGADRERSCATGVDGNQADTSCPGSGAVYVFNRSTDIWSQSSYVKASNTGATDQFGFTVALSGDTLAAGAPGEASCATGINGDQTNNSCGAAGAAYVYVAH